MPAAVKISELEKLWKKVYEIWWSRSSKSRAYDLGKTSMIVCQPDDVACIKRWIQRRGSGIDIEGFDTAIGGKKKDEGKDTDNIRKLWKEIEEIWLSRSGRSRALDIREKSSITVSPADPQGLKLWIRKRGIGVDIEGFDTPGGSAPVKIKRKSRGPHVSVISMIESFLRTAAPAKEKEEKEPLIVAANDVERVYIDYTMASGKREEWEELARKLSNITIVAKSRMPSSEFNEYLRAVRLIGVYDPNNRTWKVSPSKLASANLDDVKDAVDALIRLEKKGYIEVKGCNNWTSCIIAGAQKLKEVPFVLSIDDSNPLYYRVPIDVVRELEARGVSLRDIASFTVKVWDRTLKEYRYVTIPLYKHGKRCNPLPPWSAPLCRECRQREG